MPPTPPPHAPQQSVPEQDNKPTDMNPGEGRRVGPEDEDRRLRKDEKRPFGQNP